MYGTRAFPQSLSTGSENYRDEGWTWGAASLAPNLRTPSLVRIRSADHAAPSDTSQLSSLPPLPHFSRPLLSPSRPALAPSAALHLNKRFRSHDPFTTALRLTMKFSATLLLAAAVVSVTAAPTPIAADNQVSLCCTRSTPPRSSRVDCEIAVC